MKGWEIFIHSVRLVFANLETAFKVSALPYILSGLAFVFFGVEAMAIMRDGSPQALMGAADGLWFRYFLYVIISIISALWIAVSWHRYVLLEEVPNSWVPKFHGSEMASYFGKGFLIGLLIFGVVIVLSLGLGALFIWAGGLGAALVAIAAFAAASYLFYRLCPVLPSAALGKPMTFGEAWNATKGNSETIAVLVVLLILSSLVVQLPNQLGGTDTIIGMIYSLVVGWFMMLIGASVLTTFYGHFIEGRAID